MAAPMIGQFAGPMLHQVLKSISYGEDGNITARYMKKGAFDWQSSPLNLAQYYIKNNKLYVQLNIAQILATVEANKSKADIGSSEILKFLEAIKLIAPYLFRRCLNHSGRSLRRLPTRQGSTAAVLPGSSYQSGHSSAWLRSERGPACLFPRCRCILLHVRCLKSKADIGSSEILKFLEAIKLIAPYLSDGVPLSYSVSNGTAQVTLGYDVLGKLFALLTDEDLSGLILGKLPDNFKAVMAQIPGILEKTDDVNVTLILQKQ